MKRPSHQLAYLRWKTVGLIIVFALLFQIPSLLSGQNNITVRVPSEPPHVPPVSGVKSVITPIHSSIADYGVTFSSLQDTNIAISLARRIVDDNAALVGIHGRDISLAYFGGVGHMGGPNNDFDATFYQAHRGIRMISSEILIGISPSGEITQFHSVVFFPVRAPMKPKISAKKAGRIALRDLLRSGREFNISNVSMPAKLLIQPALNDKQTDKLVWEVTVQAAPPSQAVPSTIPQELQSYYIDAISGTVVSRFMHTIIN